MANQSGRWRNQMRRAAHDGCCHRVAQTRALCSVLWKLLISENLAEVLMRIEIPLVRIYGNSNLPQILFNCIFLCVIAYEQYTPIKIKW